HRENTQQQVIADRLQRAILPAPGGSGGPAGVRVAVRYIPADPGLHIGGDWYVSARMPDGDLLLSVGDAGGHGIAATTAMTALRPGRAWAVAAAAGRRGGGAAAGAGGAGRSAGPGAGRGGRGGGQARWGVARRGGGGRAARRAVPRGGLGLRETTVRAVCLVV